MNVFVKMFDNKFVVESPGGFLPPTTAETVYESHNPRNPYLMEALYYLDFVKCAYEGTRRMREVMREANLPEPEFAQKQVGTSNVHVTLRNNIEHRKAFLNPSIAEMIGASLYERLTEDERMLCNFIAEKGKASVSDAMRLIAKDWHAAKAILEGLVERKVLEKRGRSGKERDPSQRYTLVARGGQSKK
jgi:ATP-dependent DNA helicase RecG